MATPVVPGLTPVAPAGGEGEEGGIVGGPRTPQQIAAQRRLQQTQAQVDEVVDIMRTNVEKVLERDQKLSELDDRADALQQVSTLSLGVPPQELCAKCQLCHFEFLRRNCPKCPLCLLRRNS